MSLGMFVGFDSKLIPYEIQEPLRSPPEGIPLEQFEPLSQSKDYKRVFKFLLGASVTVKDKKQFKETYIESLQKSISTAGFEPKTNVYDSMLLVSETGYKITEIIPRLLTLLCNDIEKICLYCAYYIHPMSVYAESQPSTLLPIDFLHLIDNSFPHICAAKYVREYGNEENLELDHFQLGKTPAWEYLESSKCNTKLYFSGDICNPIISTADLIIRLIEERMRGRVDEISLRKALLPGCEIISEKIIYYNLGGNTEEKRYATPRLRLQANLNKYITHPIFFTLGKWPEEFMTTPTFIKIQEMALNNDGCIKKYEPKDQNLWDVKKDKIIILDEEEKEKITKLKTFGRRIPKFLLPSKL
jgi:hypothetical protein